MPESTPKTGPKLVLTNHDLLDDIPKASTSEYDALAALFLENAALSPSSGKSAPRPRIASDTPAASDGNPATRLRTTIEGMIVGHLPVLGAAWISQFARLRSTELGKPVILARLMDGTLSIDIVAESTTNLDHVSESDSFDAAIAAASRISPYWLLRVSEPSEIDLARCQSLNRLCHLTGADEAAMVASYRTFKGLFHGTPPSEGIADDLHLSVTIFGADPAKSGESEDKLRRAAHTFLGRDLDSAASIPKVQTCSMASIYRGKVDLSIQELVDRISHLTIEKPTAAHVSVVIEPPAMAAPQPATVMNTAPVEPAPAKSPEQLSLAAMIDGLHPLISRCPYCPDIELAVDASGALHLVAAHDSVGESGVKNLLATASWAAMHESLLAAAEPKFKPSPEAGAMLHLVCADAPSVKALLDSGIRVHLLVQIGSLSACRPLN